MSNYVVKNRIETCKMLESMIGKERIVITRYSDGEANIFRGKKGIDLQCGNEDSTVMRSILIRAIQDDRQMVCINELKESNLKKKDRWVKVQKELAEIGKHSLYWGANWNIHDFQNGNKILLNLFKGKVLIVGGHAGDIKRAFDTMGKDVDVYETRLKAASLDYDRYLRDLEKMVSIGYDNILFSCGPIGKVLIVDLISKCDSNLVDFGSLINAIIDGVLYEDRRTVRSWNMNWADKHNIRKLSRELMAKIGEQDESS